MKSIPLHHLHHHFSFSFSLSFFFTSFFLPSPLSMFAVSPLPKGTLGVTKIIRHHSGGALLIAAPRREERGFFIPFSLPNTGMYRSHFSCTIRQAKSIFEDISQSPLVTSVSFFFLFLFFLFSPFLSLLFPPLFLSSSTT